MDIDPGNLINDLNKQAELPDTFKSKNTKLLISSAQKLYKAACDSQSIGDIQKSYLSFMKYLNLVSHIKKTAQYRQDERFYKDLLGPKNVQLAIEWAEKLQGQIFEECLKRREELDVLRQLEELEMKQTIIQQESNKIVSDISPIPDKKNNEDPGTISTWELDSLIKKKSTSFLIFDVRSGSDFNNARIKHSSTYSIPQEKLKQGLSAAALCKELPVETRIVWPQRVKVDVIILVDWFGSRETGSPVNILEDIFKKWDPSSNYQGEIKLMTGGFAEWAVRFPLQITNPLVQIPQKPSVSLELFSTVSDIVYPDLDDTIKTPVKPNVSISQPLVDRKMKPDLENNIWNSVHQDPYLEQNLRNSEKSSAIISKIDPLETGVTETTLKPTPQIDRNLKKNMVMKYLEEQEEMVELSLQTTQKRLDQEKEWEELRSRKESSVDYEIKVSLQKREEELIKILKQMENDNKEQELEIARLKKEVGEYKQRDNRNSDLKLADNKEEEESIEFRIRKKEIERSVMYKEVERLRQLRKQAEDNHHHHQRIKEDERLQIERANEARRQSEEEEEERIRTQLLAEESLRKQNEEEKKKRDGENKQNFLRTDFARLKDEPSLEFTSKMNRSHSTPDLAQAIQNEVDNSMGTPKIERALKPLNNKAVIIPRPDLTRNRINFNAVYGSMGRGLVGLKNLGNTCYMNSILQCISNTSLLTHFFVNGLFRNFLNKNNKTTKGEISEEIFIVLQALWSGEYRSISPKEFKVAIGRYKSSFRGYEQQDSHEFLTILVDWLHEELNEVSIKAPLKEQNNQDIPDETAANMAWKDYTNSNKSVIVKVFGGQQRSTVKCMSCGQESVTFEPFFNLSLPIPQSRSQCSIEECFKLYTILEKVSGWSCPHCKRPREAEKKIDIWKLPPVLVIHLQRFYNDGMWRKRLTMVDLNVNELNLERVVKSNNPGYSRFKLYAVSNHYGTMDAGHYTAYAKNSEYNKWFKFDDQDVMEINGNEVRSAAAYILFFTAIDLPPD